MNKVNSQRKVIVTGATGFVGQNLIPLLLKNGFHIKAVSRDIQKAQSFEWFDKVEFIAADMGNCAEQLQISPEMSLIHLAWSGLPNYKSAFHFEENLPKSYEFIKSCVNFGVNQVLVAGTCFEYGLQSGPIPSNAKTKPNNPYAFAKDALRQQLEFLSKENPFCLQWARLFYMYGKGQNSKSVLSQLDAAIDNGDTTFNMSGGEQLRDYLSIEDLVKQLINLHELRKVGNYNICSGTPISIRRLVEERIKDRAANISLNLGYYPYPDYEPIAFWGISEEFLK